MRVAENQEKGNIMGLVGFSTGCLFKRYTVNQCLDVYARNAVKVIEFGSPDTMATFSAEHLAMHMQSFPKIRCMPPGYG